MITPSTGRNLLPAISITVLTNDWLSIDLLIDWVLDWLLISSEHTEHVGDEPGALWSYAKQHSTNDEHGVVVGEYGYQLTQRFYARKDHVCHEPSNPEHVKCNALISLIIYLSGTSTFTKHHPAKSPQLWHSCMLWVRKMNNFTLNFYYNSILLHVCR